jgi:3'-phosphoadenosine 5'-phosphosulfate (PAPS) 3'-phosphatase
MKPSLQPDQVLKTMKRKSYFTPEILSYQASVRKQGFERYLSDLSKLGEGEFSEASDVQRGIRTLSSGFENEIEENDLTFWVDPLDGSSGLAQGHTEHLTCIIGVAVNKRPILGIVHKPFSQTRTPGATVGRTYVGLPESGLFTIDNNFSDSGRAIPIKEG